MEPLKKQDFEQKVLKSKKMAVVDFSASSCQPCQRLKPVMHKISKNYKDKDDIGFYEVEMKGNEDIFSKFSVMTIPHIIFFHEGKPVDEIIGFRSEDAVVKFVERNVKNLS